MQIENKHIFIQPQSRISPLRSSTLLRTWGVKYYMWLYSIHY